MNFEDIYEISKDKEKLRVFLQNQELLGDLSGICTKCFKGTVYLRLDKSFSKDGLCWRCSNKDCGKKWSIRQDSWFSKSHLTLSQIVKLTYYWVYKYPAEIVQHELRVGSDHTTTDWFNFAREVCSEILEKDSEKLGGPGKVVEIDESKFGKRKYHRGKRVEGVWVFGGIERESRRSFFRIVEDRSADTLIPIIKEFVLPGTLIISDCWKAYSSLAKEGYIHQTVNHSVEFVNKDTGACTNTIESTWHAVKNSLPRTGTQKALYESYFSEYCIRKKYLNDSSDKFLTFLDLIKRVYPVKKRAALVQKQTGNLQLNDSLYYKKVKPNRIDRRYRRYTPESLLKAYEAVKDKKIPVKTAARQYGVPLTTLRDRVDRRIDANNFANGGTPTLSMEEEEILVEHLEVMSLLGYGYTNTKLQQFAGELAVDMGKKEKNKPMSNNWLYGFLNRWKGQLASLSPSSLDSNRAKCCTPEAVAYYFNNLNEIMSKYELSDKPHCIYNLDETGLKPDHRPPNVVSALSCKPQAITSPRSTTTTLIGCVNAIGNTVPPFFVFKGKRFYSELMNGASFSARGEMSESGWSNGDLFKKYLKEHFMPYARSGADDSQMILLVSLSSYKL